MAAAFSVLIAQPVAAFTCPRPDPWFLTTISLPQKPSLPAGVFVRMAARRTQATANEPPWDDAVLNWLEIENTTPRPLFVLEDADEFQRQMGYRAISWVPDSLGDVPSGVRTRLKVQNATRYVWPYNCAVIKCESLEWEPDAGNLMITSGTGGLSPGFEDRVTRTKLRPTQVAPPEAQPGVLRLSYEGRTLTVPFVVAYELNPNYDPAHGTDNCGGGLTVLAGVLLVLVFAAIALPVLALTRLAVRWSRRAN